MESKEFQGNLRGFRRVLKVSKGSERALEAFIGFRRGPRQSMVAPWGFKGVQGGSNLAQLESKGTVFPVKGGLGEPGGCKVIQKGP